ncbi:MAG: oligosaccharide flippase family protein [Nitrospina sp.]|nr:oligosaccharide flippase family protein [Nitrospina sp.]
MTTSKAHNNTQTAQRLVKNSAWLFFAEAAAKLTALGIQIIAARYLGDKGYGMFSYAFVGTGAILNFIDHGLRTYITREISRNPEKARDLLSHIFFLKRIITFVSVVILCIAYSLIPFDTSSLIVIFLISCAMILDGYTEIYLGVFRAFEKMKEISALMVAQRLIFFMVGLGVLALGFGIIEFCFTFLLVSVLSFFTVQRFTNRLQISAPKPVEAGTLRNTFQDSKFICLMVLFTYIYFRIDSVLIFFMLGKAETGAYTAAFKLIESMALLIAGIRGALFPILSKIYSKNTDQFQNVWKQASRFLLIIGLPLSAGFTLLGSNLTKILYGSAYQVTGPLLQIMAVAFFLLILNEFIAYLLLAANQTGTAIRIAMAGALFNITLNIIVIPRWGVKGAACVASLTEVILFLLFCCALKKINITMHFFSRAWKPILATVGMSLMMIEFAGSLIPTFLLGVGVYFFLLILFQTFNEFDILVIRNILKLKSPLQNKPTPDLPEASLQLSIIIVSFKSIDYLARCLQSIQSNLKNFEHEVIVIDNASEDESVAVLKRDFPEIILIENEKNLGFSTANNQGIAISKGRYILLLNNDTEVLPDSLETMVNTMKQSPGTGMLGCLLLNPDHTIQESFGGKLGFTQEFLRKAFFNKLFRHSDRPWAKIVLNWMHATEKDVDWIRGTCMLFQREALADVGLMDENFFMYFEDVDISLQLRLKGWGVRFTPKASIIHYQGISGSRLPYQTALAQKKSQLYFYKKYYGQWGLRLLKFYLACKFQIISKNDQEAQNFKRDILAMIKNYH